jgi:hypothetical protein
MTKASANPRRYSRGPEGLDPDQPLSVYVQVKVDPESLSQTVERLEYLADKHSGAAVDVASYRHDRGQVILVLEVGMGPARAALRGTGPQVEAGYALLWDLFRTLFYATPVFATPPAAEERASVNQMGQLRPRKAVVAAAVGAA